MTERPSAADATTEPSRPARHNRVSDRGRVVGFGVLAVAFYIALLGAAQRGGVGVEQAVADPQETTDLRFLGVVSTTGVLFWAAVVTVCLLAASVLTDRPDHMFRFFRASAAVTMMLLLDDLLLLHEFADDTVGFFVEFDHTRRRKDLLELIVFAGYGVIVGWYLVRHRVAIAATRHLPLVVAGIGLATSLVVDMGLLDGAVSMVGPGLSSRTETVIEEGAKFVGISYLTIYFFDAARSAVRHRPRSECDVRNTPYSS